MGSPQFLSHQSSTFGIKTDNRLENLELWSTSHPNGRRVEDLLAYCLAMLDRYGHEFGVFAPDEGTI